MLVDQSTLEGLQIVFSTLLDPMEQFQGNNYKQTNTSLDKMEAI